MIALDTNILVRFLVRDDEKQAQAVYRRLKRAEQRRERLRIPLLVTLETIWVLESAYRTSREDLLRALEDLRRMAVFDFEQDDVIDRLINIGRRQTKPDLADILIAHACEAQGCEEGLTFDKTAAKLDFFRLLG